MPWGLAGRAREQPVQKGPLLLKRGPGDSQDSYLGLLYPTEDYKVYGYLTNTHVKIVLLLDDEGAVKDEMVLR
ncbi:Trafficking protein particle complex subunit 2-like protein, partial [Tetrabaena socialis]